MLRLRWQCHAVSCESATNEAAALSTDATASANVAQRSMQNRCVLENRARRHLSGRRQRSGKRRLLARSAMANRQNSEYRRSPGYLRKAKTPRQRVTRQNETQ